MMDLPKLNPDGFTPEQVKAIENYGDDLIQFFVGIIDKWMLTEVLPKTINPDDHYYGSDPIKKAKLSVM